MLIWYHSIAMGLFFPYIHFHTESTNIRCMKSQWRRNCSFCPIWRIISEMKAKIEFFAKKVLNIRISLCFFLFLLIKEGNDVSNIYCKIQDHTMKTFFKIVISNIAGLHQPPLTLWLWRRLHQPPSPSWLWRLTLPPGKVVPPTFFHQNDYKGCTKEII